MDHSDGHKLAWSVKPFIGQKMNGGQLEVVEGLKTGIDNAIHAAKEPLVNELKDMESLLVGLINEGRPFEARLKRIQKLLTTIN